MVYTSIRVSTIRGDQKIAFDTYVKLGDKYVLYLRRGDSFEGERLNRLKEKSLKKMYIDADEESFYRKYLQNNIESAYDNSSKQDLGTRSEIIQGVQQSHTEEVFENPENAVVYKEASLAAGKYVDFLITNDTAVNRILNLENNDQNIAQHGVTVSTLAVSIAQKLENFDQKKLSLLALGGFLHDIGHQGSALNLNQIVSSMNPADLADWKQHAKAGADRVQDKKHFDPQVVKIILQHEENLEGKGPLALREKQIDPLALIVAVANTLDRLISFEKAPKAEVVKRFMLENTGKYPLNYMQKLNEIMRRQV